MKILRQDGEQVAMTLLLAKADQQGFPGIIPTDPLHPGLFVHVRQPCRGDVRDYLRTAEIVGWLEDM